MAAGQETEETVSQMLRSPSELRIVLLGGRAAGKSASGNTILDREEFRSGFSTSVTKVCETRTGKVAGKQVTVVDTPSLLRTDGVEIKRCISLSAPGPHAFLLVIQVYTKEFKDAVSGRWWNYLTNDCKTLDKVQELFGERALRNTMILFTHGGVLEGRTIEQYIEEAGEEFQQRVEKCENRYHVLNNKNRNDRTQVTQLLKKIDNMVKGCGGCYTIEMDIEEKIRQQEHKLKEKYLEQESKRKQKEKISKKEKEMKKKDEEEQCMKQEIKQKYEEELRSRKEEMEEVCEEELRRREEEMKQKYEEEQCRREEEMKQKYKEELKRRKEEMEHKFKEELRRRETDMEQKYEEEQNRREEELMEKMRKQMKEEELEKEPEESKLHVRRRNSNDFSFPYTEGQTLREEQSEREVDEKSKLLKEIPGERELQLELRREREKSRLLELQLELRRERERSRVLERELRREEERRELGEGERRTLSQQQYTVKTTGNQYLTPTVVVIGGCVGAVLWAVSGVVSGPIAAAAAAGVAIGAVLVTAVAAALGSVRGGGAGTEATVKEHHKTQ